MTARLLGNSYQIMCFADNDPRKHGQFIGNIPICSPSKAAALLPDLIILGVLDEERAWFYDAADGALGLSRFIL